MASESPVALLPAAWAVPEKFRRRLGDQVGRQRLMVAEGHLLLVLHAPPTAESSQREGRFFWRNADGRWTPSGASPAQPGVADLLAEYERQLDRLQREEDLALSARDYFRLLNDLNPLVRAARNLHKTIQDAREKAPDDRSIILWRDRAYVISRSAELLHNDAKNALDFAIAERAEEEAASTRRVETASHRLNVLAALFFPVATLAAIFGMDLNNGLAAWDAQYGPLPLVAILAVGLVLGVLLMLFITRKP